MKINKIIYLFLASFMLIFSACDPIVEEEHLSNSTDVEGVQLIATQSTEGGNEITIEMATPGVTGYWYNSIIGQKLTNKTKFVYPVPGKATFTFTGTLGMEFFTKTVDVQIDVLDHRLDQDYYDLVGEDTNAGKTWVFDNQGAGSLWWFMSPPGSKDSAMSVWWNAGDCCGPSDANGKMHFDLNGGPNYMHYETASAAGTEGNFNLDVANQKLTITGSTMLGSAAGNANGVYEIVTLTEDKMILYLSNSETYGTGWTFVFRPE